MICPPRSTYRDCRASTLIELLTSMAILAVLLAVLAATLQASLGQFRASIDQSESTQTSRLAVQWLKQDLELATNRFPANLPPVSSQLSGAQRELLENRFLFPFELDRETGVAKPQESGFPARNSNFSTIAFTRLNPSQQAPGSGYATPFPPLAIVGYYVAYTPNSPTSESPVYSMKLFRHFRPPGNQGDGYSDSFLRFCHREINDGFLGLRRSDIPLGEPNPAAIPEGLLGNSDLPFLLSWRSLPNLELEDTIIAGASPWPEFTKSAPQSTQSWGTRQSWQDPRSFVHDFLLPDEAVANNVVQFEVTPFHVTSETDGSQLAMSTEEVVLHYNLETGEWPCLVIPHFVEVTLGVIDEDIALRLPREEDWIVEWNSESASSSELAEMIKANTHTKKFRIALGGGV